MKQERKYASK